MSNRSRTRAGISLVEVLVVLAILAVLSAILIPAIGFARRASRRAACLSNLHQIGIALNGYANDNGGQLPVCYWYGNNDGPAEPFVGVSPDLRPAWGGPALLFRWPATYAQPSHVVPQTYVSSAAVFACPGMAAKDGWQTLPTGLLWESPTTVAASFLTTQDFGRTSYQYLYVPPLSAAAVAQFPAYAGVGRRDTIRGPAGGGAGQASIFVDWCLAEVIATGPPDVRFTNFHDAHGGGNVLYLDGHAVWWDGPAVARAAAAVASPSAYVKLTGAVDR